MTDIATLAISSGLEIAKDGRHALRPTADIPTVVKRICAALAVRFRP
jgi:hypothetical protein